MMLPIFRPDLPRKIKEAYKLAFAIGTLETKKVKKYTQVTKFPHSSDCWEDVLNYIGKFNVAYETDVTFKVPILVTEASSGKIVTNDQLAKEIINYLNPKFASFYFGITELEHIDKSRVNRLYYSAGVTTYKNGFCIVYTGKHTFKDNSNIILNIMSNRYNANELQGKTVTHVIFSVESMTLGKKVASVYNMDVKAKVFFINVSKENEQLIYASCFNVDDYISNSNPIKTYCFITHPSKEILKEIPCKSSNKIEYDISYTPNEPYSGILLILFSCVNTRKYSNYKITETTINPDFFFGTEEANKIGKDIMNKTVVYNALDFQNLAENKPCNAKIILSNVECNDSNFACCIKVIGRVNVKYSSQVINIQEG